MKLKRNLCFSVSKGFISPEFIKKKDGVVTFEARELISDKTVGSKDICVFHAVYGPGEILGKHKHTKCDEIVYCISGRGAEWIDGVEYEFAPGIIAYVPKGKPHWGRNLDYFNPLILVGIFTGVKNMDKQTIGYEALGEILPGEMKLK